MQGSGVGEEVVISVKMGSREWHKTIFTQHVLKQHMQGEGERSCYFSEDRESLFPGNFHSCYFTV